MTTDLYNLDFWERENNRNKLEFEKINLHEKVKEIYFDALKRAEEDFGNEIIEKWNYLIKTNYTEEQAQEKFNYYIEDIRYEHENDDSYYRHIKNNLPEKLTSENKEDLQNFIIDVFCSYINSDDLSYEAKLEYLKELPEQIYHSNKIQKQFEFIKNQAEKEKKEEKENNTIKKDFEYLNSLFRNTEDFFLIKDLLLKENFISEIDEFTFEWFGSIKETNLKPKKLLGTLAYILKANKYFHSTVNKKVIAESFSKTFPNNKLSEVYYGRIENNLSEAYTNSIEEDYKTAFHFIPNK